MLFNYIAVLTKEKALIYSEKLCDGKLTFDAHRTW